MYRQNQANEKAKERKAERYLMRFETAYPRTQFLRHGHPPPVAYDEHLFPLSTPCGPFSYPDFVTCCCLVTLMPGPGTTALYSQNPTLPKKMIKPGLPSDWFNPSAARLSSLRPVAFCPPLTVRLALSGFCPRSYLLPWRAAIVKFYF